MWVGDWVPRLVNQPHPNVPQFISINSCSLVDGSGHLFEQNICNHEIGSWKPRGFGEKATKNPWKKPWRRSMIPPYAPSKTELTFCCVRVLDTQSDFKSHGRKTRLIWHCSWKWKMMIVKSKKWSTFTGCWTCVTPNHLIYVCRGKHIFQESIRTNSFLISWPIASMWLVSLQTWTVDSFFNSKCR